MTARTNLRIVTLAVFALVLAAPAWARGGGPRGFARPPHGPRVAHARGVLGQLVFPCQADCATTAETCSDTATSEALACVSGSCAAEVAAAQTACGEDRSSEDCEEAVEALADCADSCLDTHADGLDTCRDALRDCRDACEDEE